MSQPWEVFPTRPVFTARHPAENRCYVKNFTNDVIFFTNDVIFFTYDVIFFTYDVIFFT